MKAATRVQSRYLRNSATSTGTRIKRSPRVKLTRRMAPLAIMPDDKKGFDILSLNGSPDHLKPASFFDGMGRYTHRAQLGDDQFAVVYDLRQSGRLNLPDDLLGAKGPFSGGTLRH